MKNWLKSLIFAALLTFATEAAKGQVYTANYGNNTVSKITSAGVLTAAWATLTSGAAPYAIAVISASTVEPFLLLPPVIP